MMSTVAIFSALILLIFIIIIGYIVRFSKSNKKLQTDLFELERLALSGNVEAMLKLGEIFFIGCFGLKTDREKAINYLQLAVKHNSGKACFILAGIYLEGKNGIKPDMNLGFDYLTKSADLGDILASRMLALEYSKDKGFFGKDIDKARRYFFKAAEGGDTISQKVIAGLYRFTAGFDKKIAFAWYKVASANNDKVSDQEAEKLYAEFTETEKVEAKKIAEDYLKIVKNKEL